MIAVGWGFPPEPLDDNPREWPLRAIIREVAAKHGLKYNDMLSKRRARKIAWPRQEAMWRCANETSASYPEIGRALGGRDHSTVIYGVEQHAKRLSTAS